MVDFEEELKNAKPVSYLEEGRTYHVIIGNKNRIPTKEDINKIRNSLGIDFPKFNWIITDYTIKISDEEMISKQKVIDVIDKWECHGNGELGDDFISEKEQLKKELELI